MKTEIKPGAKVAFLGPAGTYTHSAVLQMFGDSAQCIAVNEIQDVFASVESGGTDYGMVPVENSNEGSITATLDCFLNSPLQVKAEILLRIRHCLMARYNTSFADIVKVVAHQQSLGQCRQWLAVNLAGIERLAVSSNAEGARLASENPGVAAIAGRTASDIYNLQVLAESIEDSHDNTTRFLLLGTEPSAPPSGRDKTSIIISSHNEPGTLFRALEPFHRFGVNLTKLESRPSRKSAWSYSFYVDFEGHVDDANVQASLSAQKQHALEVKLLGSYPAAGGADARTDG